MLACERWFIKEKMIYLTTDFDDILIIGPAINVCVFD